MARLQDALEWIAFNDAPGDDLEPEDVAFYLTTALVADVWGKKPSEIAERVVKIRRRKNRDELVV